MRRFTSLEIGIGRDGLWVSHRLASGTFPRGLNHQNRVYASFIFLTFSYLATAMPRKRVSDDIDHVPIDLKPSKIPRTKPPSPSPPPQHVPILINNPLLHGQSRLPEHLEPSDVYGIFSLFFTDDILSTIRDNTNEYAKKYPSEDDKLFAREWHETTIQELRAYIGVYIWMGLHPETARKDYWNTNIDKGPIHERVRQAIGLKR